MFDSQTNSMTHWLTDIYSSMQKKKKKTSLYGTKIIPLRNKVFFHRMQRFTVTNFIGYLVP